MMGFSGASATRTWRPPLAVGAALVFCSGFCALVYQLVWAREFRLVFGASTLASAAVLAVFSVGLGAGSVVLSSRADRATAPLRFYGRIEGAIAISAAASLPLLTLVRWVYLSLGGTLALGSALGTGLRLLLACAVAFVPTFLMGGTLPALVRAFPSADDHGRSRVAYLYGANTLGAVAGCVVTTFVLLEAVGTRETLLFAAGLNLVVAAGAVAMARRTPAIASDDAEDEAHRASEVSGTSVEHEEERPLQPEAHRASEVSRGDRSIVYAAAALTGLAFFAMEIIWYRMLGPLLGGSIFSFGIILAVALLGIGLGGFSFSLLSRFSKPSMRQFAFTGLVEALALVVPYALGDRLAVVAIWLRPAATFGFAGQVGSWAALSAVVVLPAAIVAGYQFPLLVALLGRGRSAIGRHTGSAYLFNTAGSAVGSILSGFWALPALGATTTWRVLAIVLAAAACAVLCREALRGRRLEPSLAAGAALLFATGWCVTREGPSAVWRHSPIGAGRVELASVDGADALEEFARSQRRSVVWQKDGRESSVAISDQDGYAFIVNGKSDGHVRGDAATQVGAGVLAALLHPEPRRAAVIGLGTGSTAGWLGSVGSVERVDVFELEESILEMARRSAPIANSPLENPKVHVHIGDARELLTVSKQSYDIVFSEPSNPYRAGIASLYTREYYELARARMHGDDAVFLQWVQAYETTSETVRSIYATLHSVFPSVETWELLDGDLLLVARTTSKPYDVAALRARLGDETLRAGFDAAWQVHDLEGVLAHHVARPSLADDIARLGLEPINTDDRCSIEFGLARSVGTASFHPSALLAVARGRQERLPELVNGSVDVERIAYLSAILPTATRRGVPRAPTGLSNSWQSRVAAVSAWTRGDCDGALAAWSLEVREPVARTEALMLATCTARRGDAAAFEAARARPELHPSERALASAVATFIAGRPAESARELAVGFDLARRDPWIDLELLDATVGLTTKIADAAPETAQSLFDALEAPFPVSLAKAARLQQRVRLTRSIPAGQSCAVALAPFEPEPPWAIDLLTYRAECYERTGSPLLPRARADLAELRRRGGADFAEGLLQPKEPAPVASKF